MKKIITLLLIASIAKGQRMNDDSKHFYAGLGISVCTSALVYELTDNNKLSLAIGFASGVGAGVLKEYWRINICKEEHSVKKIYIQQCGVVLQVYLY